MMRRRQQRDNGIGMRCRTQAVMVICTSCLLCFLLQIPQARGFSGPLVSDASLDRFVAICPANVECVRQYDASLLLDKSYNQHDDEENYHPHHENDIWVAVYRSNHNMPSVVVRDQLWSAMNIATQTTTTSSYEINQDETMNTNMMIMSSSSSSSSSSHSQITSSATSSSSSSPLSSSSAPVAVARLRPSLDFDHTWILDSMRCVLKKDDANFDCDGGSEHAEAIAVAIDTLLCHHLRQNHHNPFSIRSKATLVSSKLLEERGFMPVNALARDMCSHVSSSIDECLARYANRAVNQITVGNHQQHRLSPTARDHALQMVTLLGQVQSNRRGSQDGTSLTDEDEEKPEDDYWANLGKISL